MMGRPKPIQGDKLLIFILISKSSDLSYFKPTDNQLLSKLY